MMTDEVLPDDDQRDSSWTNVLLSASEDNSVLYSSNYNLRYPQVYNQSQYLQTFLMSTGRDMMLDDMSTTRGIPFVSGTESNSTPSMVSLSQ